MTKKTTSKFKKSEEMSIIKVNRLISDAKLNLKMRNKNENYFQEIAKTSLSVFDQKYIRCCSS